MYFKIKGHLKNVPMRSFSLRMINSWIVLKPVSILTSLNTAGHTRIHVNDRQNSNMVQVCLFELKKAQCQLSIGFKLMT